MPRTFAVHAIATPMLACLCALLLSACGSDDKTSSRNAAEANRQQTLPVPVATGGVTGAADIGPGGKDDAPSLGAGPEVAISVPHDPATGLVIQGGSLTGDPQALNPETGLGIDPDGEGPLTAPPGADAGAAEPTAADAVTVIRDYYAAINARDFAKAHRYWSDNGAASGQSAPQFANGFAQTHGVSVQIGAPGALDAGAGQRYVSVPVSLSATQTDGSVLRFAGSFVMHRTVVDGASPEERAWRIRSADLREVQ